MSRPACSAGYVGFESAAPGAPARELRDMTETHRSRDPLDAYATLEEAREGLEQLEALRAASIPPVVVGLVVALAVAWLRAQVAVEGATPLVSNDLLQWALLALWTFNALVSVQFLVLALRAWRLRLALERYYAGLPEGSDSTGWGGGA